MYRSYFLPTPAFLLIIANSSSSRGVANKVTRVMYAQVSGDLFRARAFAMLPSFLPAKELL